MEVEMQARTLVFLGMVVIVALIPLPGWAQSDGFAFTGINFNFTNPGARARGIGGAFVALADDSTAALANPAGLAYLDREFSLEWIHDEEEYPVGQLTQDGVQESVGTGSLSMTALHDPFRVRAESTSDRLNYASVLLPLKKDRVTLALFYGVLADLESRFQVGDGVVCVDPSGHARLPAGGESCTFNFLDPENSESFTRYRGQSVGYSLNTETMGAALGYRFGDRWSVGASIALGQTTMKALAERSSDESGQVNQESLGDDNDLIYGLGLLYRAEEWGFGLSYRSDSSYELKNRMMDGEGVDLPDQEAFSGVFRVPQRVAAGLAFFPTEDWVISTEISQVWYSQVLEEMQPFDLVARRADIRYRMDDVTEYHVGVEYTKFRGKRGWSMRAGWWRDQTHLPWVRESYEDPVGDPDGDGTRAQESLIRAPFAEDIDHFTVGLGLSSGVLRLDAALDWTDASGVDYLLSGVFYF